MRIGVLTGGGDVPGLNVCIKAIVTRASAEGHQVVGIRRGWRGLVAATPEDPDTIAENLLPLDTAAVRAVDRTGGTFLHTSRTNPGRVKGSQLPAWAAGQYEGEGPHDLTKHVIRVIESEGIDVLITIGGDDTLSYATRISTEGVPVIAVPKTMDNDVSGTDYCIGFSTAVTRGVEFIHSLRTTAGSHERIAIVELFGRHSGETSLVTGYLAGVDRTLIAEVPFDPDRLAALLREDKASNPSRYAMVTVSEGARLVEGRTLESGEPDPYGHRRLGGIGALTGELIKARTGEDTVVQQLAYLMRSGAPDSLDRMVAANYAVLAVDLAIDGTVGRLVSLSSGRYTHVPIEETRAGPKRVDVSELYDPEAYRPKVRHALGKPMFLY